VATLDKWEMAILSELNFRLTAK